MTNFIAASDGKTPERSMWRYHILRSRTLQTLAKQKLYGRIHPSTQILLLHSWHLVVYITLEVNESHTIQSDWYTSWYRNIVVVQTIAAIVQGVYKCFVPRGNTKQEMRVIEHENEELKILCSDHVVRRDSLPTWQPLHKNSGRTAWNRKCSRLE